MVKLPVKRGPLSGKTVLITRAHSQASILAGRIQELGGQVWEFPVIAIAPPPSWAPLDEALAGLAQYGWLVVTSANGAEAIAERLAVAGGAELPAGIRVAAVGAATERALAARGIRVDLVPPDFRGAALPGVMGPLLTPGDRVLMPRGDLADPALAGRLRQLGARVDDVVAYRTLAAGGDVAALRTALVNGAIHYVTLTSSSTVHNLLARLGGADLLAGARIACIGPQTRKAAVAAGLNVHVMAGQATIDGLAEAIACDAAGGTISP